MATQTNEVLSPGVYGSEKAPGRQPEGFSPAKAAFVGWTDEGPANVPVEVRSVEDFTATFGGVSTLGLVPLSIQGFFATGGERAVIVRATPADALFASAAVDPVPGPTKWTFTSLGAGTYGNDTTVRIRGNQSFLNRTPGAVAWLKFDLLVMRPTDFDPTIIGSKETYEAVVLDNPTDPNYLATIFADPRRPSQYITLTTGTAGVPSSLIGSSVADANVGTGTGVQTNFAVTLVPNVLDGNFRLVSGGTKYSDQAQTPTIGAINGVNMAYTLTLPNAPALDGTVKFFFAKTPSILALTPVLTGPIDGINKTFSISNGALGSAVYRESAVFRIRYAATDANSPQLLSTTGVAPATLDLSTTPILPAAFPIHPGTVAIAVTTVANGVQTITDDGAGNLTNPLALAAPGTINYATGNMTGITLSLTALSTVNGAYDHSLVITKGATASNTAQAVPLVGSLDGTGINTINLTDSATAPTTNGIVSFKTFVAPLNGTTIYVDFVRTGIINSSNSGVLSGDVTGAASVNFQSGAANFTANVPPKTGTTIDANYQAGLVVTDNGLGKLIGAVAPAGNNTINYTTGAIDVTFSPAPALNAPLLATYDVLAPYADFPLTGGTNGSAIGRNDISAASLEATKKGIYALDLWEEPLNVVVPDFEGSEFVQYDMVQFARNRSDSRFLIMGFANGTSVKEAVQYVLVTQAWDEKVGALYYPNVYVANPATGRAELMPITPFVAGVYAKTAHNKNVGKAPGGVEDGALASDFVIGSELGNKLELADRNSLYQARINPIISSNATGLSVWGVRALSTEQRWRYINVRLLNNYLMYATTLQLEWAVFENNGPPLWARITTALKGFYGSLFRSGYFFGDTEAQAFFITCDSTNNNAKTISQGKAIIDIGFAPNTPAEFIEFSLQQPVGQQQNF